MADQYRHCKTIMTIGAATALLGLFDIPGALPNGQPDPGLISVASVSELDDGIAAFVAAVGAHRHPARDQDPPKT